MSDSSAVSETLVRRLDAFSDHAEKIYKKEDVESRIDMLASFYHYGYSTLKEANPMDMHVNKVYPRVRTDMAALYAKRPEIIAKPRRAMDQQSAQTSEILLNYLTRHEKLSRELRECLFWSRLTMYGCVKLGMEDFKGSYLPTFRAFDPRAVRVDVSPDRFRPEEGRWQKFRFRRSIADLRASDIYEEKYIDVLSAALSKGNEEFSEDTTHVWLWENYLVDGKKIMLCTEASGSADKPDRSDSSSLKIWIREEEWVTSVGLPGRFIFFIPSPKKWYPASPVEMWIEQQKMINGIKTQEMLSVERSNPGMLYDESMFSEPEREKISDPNPQKWLGVQTGGKSLKDAAVQIPMAAVANDLIRAAIEADNIISEIAGSGSAQLGVEAPQTGSTSATRDAIVENSFRMRAGDNQEVWEEFLEDVYQGLLNLGQGHMKGNLYLKLFGSQEVRMSREDIQGDIDVILSFGSTLPTDREKEWARGKEYYELMMANPNINQVALTRWITQKEGDIKNVDDFMAAPMPMMPPGAPPVPGGGGPPMGMPPGMPPGIQMQPPGQSPLGIAAGLRGSVQ